MNEETIVSNEEIEVNTEEITEVVEEHHEDVSDVEPSAEQSLQNKEDETTIRELQKTISSLKEQISELEKARDSQEKMLGQLTDFATLFPAVDIECIPECVWETVKKGTSLAAAYALYEKRMEAERLKIEKINAINSSRAAGSAGKNTANEFFTPDDVRKMSRSEVRANFTKIKNSMKKWN